MPLFGHRIKVITIVWKIPTFGITCNETMPTLNLKY